MKLLLIFAVILAVAMLYVLLLRPFLEGAGIVKPLPSGALSWRDRLAAHIRKSLTMLASWITGFFGTALAAARPLADFLGDSELKTQVLAILKPEYVPFYIIGLAVLFGVSRFRTAQEK